MLPSMAAEEMEMQGRFSTHCMWQLGSSSVPAYGRQGLLGVVKIDGVIRTGL